MATSQTQKKVNIFQPFGQAGEFYDNSPRRVAPGIAMGSTASSAIAAKGFVSMSAGNPVANDTVTIGASIYKFVAEAPAAAFEVALGDNATATAANLNKAIMASGTAGTDYGTGTTANASVSSVASGESVVLTAKTAGSAGNSIALSASGANISVTAMTGGTDATGAVPATVGRVFTIVDAASIPSNPPVTLTVQQGGTGVFAGILVNPKVYANSRNLNPSYELEDGTIAEFATMGHIIVEVETAVTIGQVAIYNNATGKVASMNSGGSAPAGYTALPNSKFVLVNSAAGELAVLELTD